MADIEEDPLVTAVDAELDASWGVKKIGADTVWTANPSNQGDGIKIAIIDTGINYNHEDLSPNYVTGYDFVNDDSDPFDDNGHGTHCAGIIAAANNDKAVVGVAPEAELYSLKVLNAAGSGYTSDIIAAIQWAIANDMDVISMSLGSTVGSTALQQACDAAFNSGIVVVAAAGNNGAARIGSNIIYPARYANVIAVGATDQNNVRAYFSCTGPELDIMAPGVNILSDYIDVTPNDGMNRDVVHHERHIHGNPTRSRNSSAGSEKRRNRMDKPRLHQRRWRMDRSGSHKSPNGDSRRFGRNGKRQPLRLRHSRRRSSSNSPKYATSDASCSC